MLKFTVRAALTLLVAAALAIAVAVLMVVGAQATPQQPNVPVFTYGSG
jgi:hypothetical protein